MPALSFRGTVPFWRAMTRRTPNVSRFLHRALLAAALLCLPAASLDAQARTVRPGAPGEAGRTLSADELAEVAHPTHTEADVLFMQGMLVHHAQALVMTALVSERATGQNIRLLAQRIELSQGDEMRLMERWLSERGAEVPSTGAAMDHGAMEHHAVPAGDAHAGHGGMEHPSAASAPMHGMLSEEQLDALRGARGAAFDQLFLQGMIQHHVGAIDMVQELFSSPGSGQEEEIFTFASHVEADQNIEIRRMQGMLGSMR